LASFSPEEFQPGSIWNDFGFLVVYGTFLTLDRAGTAFPLLATIFAACKFAFLAVAIAYLLASLTMRLRGRGAATETP
jgi:hypothetical protein